MGNIVGRPFKGILNSADADPAIAVPIYEDGSNTAYTLQSDEYLVIDYISIVTAVGGDAYVFVGPDNSVGTGETLVRGTYAVNGGETAELKPPHSGKIAETLWAFAAEGAVDVKVHGTIRTEGDNTSVKPDWREKDFGQS